MLADVRRDECVAAGDFPQFLQYVLWLDRVPIFLVAQAVFLAPLVDLLPPRSQLGSIGSRRRCFDLGQQLDQHFAHVADDRNVNLDALRNRRRIDVDMNDLARIGREMFGIADHAIVEARTDGNQNVTVLHRHVGFVRSVHARHADEFFVACFECPQPH